MKLLPAIKDAGQLLKYTVENFRRLERGALDDLYPKEHSIPFPLDSNWSDFSPTWDAAEITKVGNIVFLKGLLQRSGPSTLSLLVGTLPEGYRPSAGLVIATIGRSGTTATIRSHRLDIDSDGTVTIGTTENSFDNGTGSDYWVSLGGVSFKAGG